MIFGKVFAKWYEENQDIFELTRAYVAAAVFITFNIKPNPFFN